MAYFEHRKAGWRAQIRRKGLPSISRTFDRRSEAVAWAHEIELELRRGNLSIIQTESTRPTFNEIAERYITDALPALRSAKTSLSFLRRAQEHFGLSLVTAIRGVDIATWRDDLLRSGMGPRSVTYCLSVLSATFTYAARELSIHLPSGNPVQLVRKPKLPPGRDRRLRQGELEALLHAASDSKSVGLKQVITLAVETSMRLGELLDLHWKHIDLRARTAHLPMTKNGTSRTVALSTAAVDAFNELRSKRPVGRVFGWGSKYSLEKAWSRCRARAQEDYRAACIEVQQAPDPSFLADLRFHDLRHEATSRLFERGLGIMEVASMTGHKSLSMLKRYTHVDASRLAQKLS